MLYSAGVTRFQSQWGTLLSQLHHCTVRTSLRQGRAGEGMDFPRGRGAAGPELLRRADPTLPWGGRGKRGLAFRACGFVPFFLREPRIV